MESEKSILISFQSAARGIANVRRKTIENRLSRCQGSLLKFLSEGETFSFVFRVLLAFCNKIGLFCRVLLPY